jgi:hypothetical protein
MQEVPWDNIEHNGILWAHDHILSLLIPCDNYLCCHSRKFIRCSVTTGILLRRVGRYTNQYRDAETSLQSVSQIMQLRIMQIGHVRLSFAVTGTLKDFRALVTHIINDNKWLGQTLAFTSNAPHPTATPSPHLLKHLQSRVTKAHTQTPR